MGSTYYLIHMNLICGIPQLCGCAVFCATDNKASTFSRECEGERRQMVLDQQSGDVWELLHSSEDLCQHLMIPAAGSGSYRGD